MLSKLHLSLPFPIAAAGENWAGSAWAVPELAPGPSAHPRHSQTDLLWEHVPALLCMRRRYSSNCQSHRTENGCGFGERGCKRC